ncbi:hypothetical protein HWV62_6603 [Athelia sp. TMB]|nr:hypothetical protein HWV62_6603 [Athelia sp. TMB]
MASSLQTKELVGAPLDVPHALTVAHFLLAAHATSNGPDALFYDDVVSLTRLQISEKAVQLARSWRQSRWVEPGEIVIVLSPSRPEFLIPVFALHLIGCTVSPCNPLVKAEEFASQLKLSKASKVIAATSSVDIAKAGLKEAGIEDIHKNLVIFSGTVEGIPTLESFMSDTTNPTFDHNEWTVHGAPAFICWSSGTSGPPKALALTHRNVIANILQFKALLGDRFNDYAVGRIDEVHIDVLPQFHAYGLITTLLAYHTCTPRYVMERFDVNQFADIAERTHATFSMLVPPAWYGCTECSPIISAQAPKDVLAGKTGVGPIAPGMRLRIVDVITEKDVGRNEPGEIRAQGPNVFTGYIDNEATKDAFDSLGFYKTGDIGVLDDDANGTQTAAILISHPAVSDAAVIGIYDEAHATELPKAYAVAIDSDKSSNVLAQEVLTYVNSRVANYKKLRGGLEWIQAIPKNASGKILRRQLRELPQNLDPAHPLEHPLRAPEKRPSPLSLESSGSSSSQKKVNGHRRSRSGRATKLKGKSLDGFSNMLLMMDEPSYHAACFSIYTFADDIDISVIHAFFRELVIAFPKYRQVVIHQHHTFSPAAWADYTEVEDSKHWRLEDNIREVTLPSRANGRNALFAEAGNFLAAKFDYKRPVWEALLVHNVNPTEYNGCAALMIKIHHCFSDGQGMIQSYHSALHALNHDISVGAVQRDADAKQAKAKEHLKKLGKGKIIAATHNHAWHSIRRLFITGRRQTFAYTDSRGEKRAEGRVYAHSKGTPLSELALVRKAFSTEKYKVTLNDVACAIATLAFRRVASKSIPGGVMPEKSIALLIPISLRPDFDWDLENYSSGAIAWFGWGKKQEKDFQSVVLQVHHEMKMIKRSKFAAWGLSLLKHTMKWPINYQPRWPLLRHLYNKAFEQYHILTNVPGPSTPVSFGGVQATSYHVLPPSSPGKASMAIGLVSYAGQFSIAISCDRVSELRPLPMELCTSFEAVAAEVVADAKARLAKAQPHTTV